MMGQKTVESVAASVRRTVMVLTIAALMTVVLVLMSTGPASASVKGGTQYGGNDKGYGLGWGAGELHNPHNGNHLGENDSNPHKG
jgi:hypothetical protein